MTKVTFLHEPQMKENINLDLGEEDLDELTNLLNEFSKEKDITRIKDKSLIIGILNEDFQIIAEEKFLDKKCDEIKQVFGGSIPDKTEMQNQYEELDYMLESIKKQYHPKETEELLNKKKKEKNKLITLWKDICEHTPQLKKCAKLKKLEDNDNLEKCFNEILENIAVEMKKS